MSCGGSTDLWGVSIVSNSCAFVAIKKDGSAMSWGHANYGGDSCRVAAALTSGVVSIVSNSNAFVAIKDDGSAVSWGNANDGRNSSRVAATRLFLCRIVFYCDLALHSSSPPLCSPPAPRTLKAWRSR